MPGGRCRRQPCKFVCGSQTLPQNRWQPRLVQQQKGSPTEGPVRAVSPALLPSQAMLPPVPPAFTWLVCSGCWGPHPPTQPHPLATAAPLLLEVGDDVTT